MFIVLVISDTPPTMVYVHSGESVLLFAEYHKTVAEGENDI